jgi:hypothetical protein
MKRIFLLLLLFLCLLANLFPQSSITIEANTVLTAGANTDICANSKSIAGTLSGSGTWCLGVLPVELVSFTGQRNKNNILLEWNTATEIQNYGFEVLYRRSAEDEWTTIIFVPGHGNSNVPCFYSYLHENVPAERLLYRLKQIDHDGNIEYSHTVEVSAAARPYGFVLSQNYPNPFNPATVIDYQIPQPGYTSVKVHDLLGREVAMLVNAFQQAGIHSVVFDASKLSGGFYCYSLRSGGFAATKLMLLLK